MLLVADLQLHSKYSRAVSKHMTILHIYEWNLKKGLDLLATGEWTHPLWLKELKSTLEDQGNGLLRMKKAVVKRLKRNEARDPFFLLSGEVSCIYSHQGKVRRNHLLLFAPSFTVVDKINTSLTKRGCNLSSDGRPILGLSSQEVCEVVWSIDPDTLVIPAHAWTPWFSVFGSMSGYDSLAECFGPCADRIYAIETGLSSDPAMNWRVKELDTRSLISCSDAHSGGKLMREATIFEIPKSFNTKFQTISAAIKNYQRDMKKPSIAATVEFYPEEGKYHFSGHRVCQVRWSPEEVTKKGKICPVCGKRITVGVLNRIEELASRTIKELQLSKKQLSSFEVSAVYSNAFLHKAPFIKLIPLLEIIAESLGFTVQSRKVQDEYDRIVKELEGEFNVLVKTPKDILEKIAGEKVTEGIARVRKGDIMVMPGYDGVFGTVNVWSDKEKVESKKNK